MANASTATLEKQLALLDGAAQALRTTTQNARALQDENRALKEQNRVLHGLVEAKQHELAKYVNLVHHVKHREDLSIVTEERLAVMKWTLKLPDGEGNELALRQLSWLQEAADRSDYKISDPRANAELQSFRMSRFDISYKLLHEMFW